MRSVRLGPMRSASRPQPYEATAAITISTSRMLSACPWLSPTAVTAKALMTAIAVLTGSL